MYQYESGQDDRFDIRRAYIQIAAAAALFSAKGQLDIWIYLNDSKLQFHRVELKCLGRFFIGHYRSQALMHGLTSKAWDKLGSKLARVWFQSNR